MLRHYSDPNANWAFIIATEFAVKQAFNILFCHSSKTNYYLPCMA